MTHLRCILRKAGEERESMKKMRIRGTKEWKEKAILVGTLDLVTILGSYFLALLLRFDFLFSSIDPSYVEGFLRSILPWAAVTIAVFYVCRLYHSIWSLASTAELLAILRAYLILLPVYWVLKVVLKLHMPRSYYVVGFIINFCMTTGMRFSYRVLRTQINDIRHGGRAVERIMLIGGGAAGQMLIKEMQNSSRVNAKICCVIDDNPNKKGRFIEGIEIVGNRYDIVNMAKKYRIDTIIYAIPSNDLKERTAILNICKETQCRLRTIPGMYQLVNDEVRVSMLRDVDIADLLGREQVSVNNDEILTSIKGLTVLVTGGGGSIGSELCRQIAKANPRQLIIFEIYENNAYEIQQELKRRYPELNLVTLIGSVRNTSRINDVMKTYRPDVVFHAAAHKHVPLMEDSPNEAIKNNVFGTYKTAMAAAENGVHKFVLISTDKAVNPTNIMGASKRLCEMVVQMMDRRYADTSFVAVRFGNVLGSNGSVIPLFKKQIAEGGPVTVTDKRVTRFFMTIPEAVSLILQAGAYAEGGEVFVLDMGEPIRIDDMARKMIRLSGFEPDVDIKIEYTGLRPGEKLYEELLLKSEGLQKTDNKLIYIGHQVMYTPEEIEEKLETLRGVLYAPNAQVRDCMLNIIKEPADRMYEPIPGAVNPKDVIEV